MSTLHKNITPADNHPAIAFQFADAPTRLAAAVTGADVCKMAQQLDDGSVWILKSANPATWMRWGEGGGSDFFVDGAGQGISLFVRPNGSDVMGDGSQAHPFASLQRAFLAVPKDLYNRRVWLDVTGLDLTANPAQIPIPPVRANLRSLRSVNGVSHISPYFERCGALNIFAQPTVVTQIPWANVSGYVATDPISGLQTLNLNGNQALAPGALAGMFLVCTDPNQRGFFPIVSNTANAISLAAANLLPAGVDLLVVSPGAKLPLVCFGGSAGLHLGGIALLRPSDGNQRNEFRHCNDFTAEGVDITNTNSVTVAGGNCSFVGVSNTGGASSFRRLGSGGLYVCRMAAPNDTTPFRSGSYSLFGSDSLPQQRIAHCELSEIVVGGIQSTNGGDDYAPATYNLTQSSIGAVGLQFANEIGGRLSGVYVADGGSATFDGPGDWVLFDTVHGPVRINNPNGVALVVTNGARVRVGDLFQSNLLITGKPGASGWGSGTQDFHVGPPTGSGPAYAEDSWGDWGWPAAGTTQNFSAFSNGGTLQSTTDGSMIFYTAHAF